MSEQKNKKHSVIKKTDPKRIGVIATALCLVSAVAISGLHQLNNGAVDPALSATAVSLNYDSAYSLNKSISNQADAKQLQSIQALTGKAENNESTTAASGTPTTYDGNEITMLYKGVCIGDSMTAGWFDRNESGKISKVTDTALAYPAILNRITGVELEVFAQGTYTFPDIYNKMVSENESFSGSGIKFATIFLGINDADTYKCWSEESETALENIVNKLRSEVQGVKIFIITAPMYISETEADDEVAEGIRAKAEELDLYLIDLRKDWSECSAENWQNYGVAQGSHFHSWGQYQLAEVLKSYISYIIKNNPEDFSDLQFVGTNYGWIE